MKIWGIIYRDTLISLVRIHTLRYIRQYILSMLVIVCIRTLSYHSAYHYLSRLIILVAIVSLHDIRNL